MDPDPTEKMPAPAWEQPRASRRWIVRILRGIVFSEMILLVVVAIVLGAEARRKIDSDFTPPAVTTTTMTSPPETIPPMPPATQSTTTYTRPRGKRPLRGVPGSSGPGTSQGSGSSHALR